MQFLFFILIVAAMVGAVATGVVYVTEEPDRASIHLDKQRLEEVTEETKETVKAAVEKVRDEAKEFRESVKDDKTAPETTPEASPSRPE